MFVSEIQHPKTVKFQQELFAVRWNLHHLSATKNHSRKKSQLKKTTYALHLFVIGNVTSVLCYPSSFLWFWTRDYPAIDFTCVF